MNNIKKLSLLLLALSGAGLTACNSGSSSTQTPKQNTVANTESVTAQKLDASTGMAESIPSIKGDHGTIGYVVTSEGNLDYYNDDKFIRIVYKFPDHADGVQLVQVGNAIIDRPSIIYVSTHTANFGAFRSNSAKIYRCLHFLNQRTVQCSQIYDLDVGVAANGEIDMIGGIYFDANGNGFATHSSGILQFKDNTHIKTKNLVANNIDMAGNTIFLGYNGAINKFEGIDDTTPIKYPTENIINKFSIDKDANGFATYNNPGILHGKLLYRVARGNATVIHQFENEPVSLSSLGPVVYVGTKDSRSSFGKYGELKKCDLSGNCSTIDTFGSGAMGVSFREF